MVLHGVVQCIEVCLVRCRSTEHTWELGCYKQVLPPRLESHPSMFQQKAITLGANTSFRRFPRFPTTFPPPGKHQPICILEKMLAGELWAGFLMRSEPL